MTKDLENKRNGNPLCDKDFLEVTLDIIYCIPRDFRPLYGQYNIKLICCREWYIEKYYCAENLIVTYSVPYNIE